MVLVRTMPQRAPNENVRLHERAPCSRRTCCSGYRVEGDRHPMPTSVSKSATAAIITSSAAEPDSGDPESAAARFAGAALPGEAGKTHRFRDERSSVVKSSLALHSTGSKNSCAIMVSVLSKRKFPVPSLRTNLSMVAAVVAPSESYFFEKTRPWSMQHLADVWHGWPGTIRRRLKSALGSCAQ
jgi:hypothetical protein